MKKIISCLMAAAAVLPVSAGISDDAAMAPYVYPENSPARVAAPAYMPDGQSYLELSSDRKRIVKFDSRTGKELETVMDVTHTRETTIPVIENFIISPDGTKLIVCRER